LSGVVYGNLDVARPRVDRSRAVPYSANRMPTARTLTKRERRLLEETLHQWHRAVVTAERLLKNDPAVALMHIVGAATDLRPERAALWRLWRDIRSARVKPRVDLAMPRKRPRARRKPETPRKLGPVPAGE
jgi:hypothetical protein